MRFCLILIGVLAFGCASAYRPPRPEEPHAILKFRRGYEKVTGARLHELIDVTGEMGLSEHVLVGEVQAPRTSAILIHPRVEKIRIAATFTHTEVRQVHETYSVQVPYSSYETYSCGTYNSPRTCGRSVTHYRTESRRRWVTKPVDVVDASCSREVGLSPEVGGIYLLDYTFRDHDSCSLSCFEQTKRDASGEMSNARCRELSVAEWRALAER